ncbi:hypothetical protein ZEAMMB73_Zm00001d044262 [Zea mays]|uniref:Uncharacterized protein n=1 Tax=Zea mays TaxID=4577 RepID=A0A1D6NJZ5_MAIZE|nr:hypothetical protein ZEAMMB73_Zm00001d044262 [Zea mays]
MVETRRSSAAAAGKRTSPSPSSSSVPPPKRPKAESSGSPTASASGRAEEDSMAGAAPARSAGSVDDAAAVTQKDQGVDKQSSAAAESSKRRKEQEQQQPAVPWAKLLSECSQKMVVFVMRQAVWNAVTNNEVVQGFRRSLHDETRLSYMLSCGSLERLLNMRNLKLWMVRMTMMKTMMMIMIQRRTRELLEGKGNRENDLQSASSSEILCSYAWGEDGCHSAAAVCSLQSLGAASPAKSELAEIVPQEKSPKGQAESLGTELLEMVPSREEEIKLKEYREDVVSTFVVDDYVRLEFKGSTFTGSWKSFSSPKISSTFLLVIAIVSNGIVIYVWMMKTVLLDVKSTNTIVQIKSKIGALEGIVDSPIFLVNDAYQQMFERKIGRLSTLFLAMEEGFLALVSSL